MTLRAQFYEVLRRKYAGMPDQAKYYAWAETDPVMATLALAARAFREQWPEGNDTAVVRATLDVLANDPEGFGTAIGIFLGQE